MMLKEIRSKYRFERHEDRVAIVAGHEVPVWQWLVNKNGWWSWMGPFYIYDMYEDKYHEAPVTYH